MCRASIIAPEQSILCIFPTSVAATVQQLCNITSLQSGAFVHVNQCTEAAVYNLLSRLSQGTHNMAGAVKGLSNIRQHHGTTHESQEMGSAGLCPVLLADTAQRSPASKLTIIDSEDALIVESDGVHDGLLRSCCRSCCRL